jgi:hypothetical protein
MKFYSALFLVGVYYTHSGSCLLKEGDQAPEQAGIKTRYSSPVSATSETGYSSPVAGYIVEDSTNPFGVSFKNGSPSPQALASAVYDVSSLNNTGWAVLDLIAKSTATSNDTLISYAAGFVEGYLTSNEMINFSDNTGASEPNSNALQKFLDDNYAWMQSQIKVNKSSYWQHVESLLAQVQGLADGQESAAKAAGTVVLGRFTVYNSIIQGGDIFNLAQVYGITRSQKKRSPLLARLHETGRTFIEGEEVDGLQESTSPSRVDHCSALISLLPQSSDILMTHTTWSGLTNMLRILKRYEQPLSNIGGGQSVPGTFTAVSSYPTYGPYSSDDFYVMGPSGIVSQETTINNDNLTLAEEFASTEVILEWARNVLANRLANTARQWTSTFSTFASGTYTNSWMILDTKLFSPGSKLQPETLMVLEEMPGNIAIHDRTPTLQEQGYWSSFNVPSDVFIFNISGQQLLVDKYGGITGDGSYFSFQNTSRSRIFQRDAPNVIDEVSFEKLIRYNDAPNDPLSKLACGNSNDFSFSHAIADRSDLNIRGNKCIGGGRSASGAIDAKYTKASWVKSSKPNGVPLKVKSGPTNDAASCPTFSWLNATVNSPHVGLPDTYNFDWLREPWQEV